MKPSKLFCFKNNINFVIRVNVVLNKTIVDSDRRFDNLCDGHLESRSDIKLWLLI